MNTRKRLIALIASGFLLVSLLSVGSYALGNSLGYQSGYNQGNKAGYQQGHTSGYSQGETDGYSRGSTNGYSQGYNAELENFQQWLDQSCFNYPFLLLDTSQYMACHR
jgi:flagellar biosynthesis/type III secretory pathway protein FliH